MHSFKVHKHHPNIYLYYRFDLRTTPDLEVLKARTLFKYLYSSKNNDELLGYNTTIEGNWNDLLLIAYKDRVLRENPNIQEEMRDNGYVYFNVDLTNKNLLPLVIPRKSFLIIFVPNEQFDYFKGLRSEFDFDSSMKSNINNNMLNIIRYKLDQIYDIRFSPIANFSKTTRAILQDTVTFTEILKYIAIEIK